MPAKKTKNQKNRYAKSAKYSEYKILQLVECFARDLSVKDAATVTKMTERTVRDRYADIRAKLLSASTEQPDLFNGFGHLLLDADGSLNAHVLEAMVFYSHSPAFKARMAARYPKFRTERDPALHHVIEMAVRRFSAMEPPETDGEFLAAVRGILATTQAEAVVRGLDRPRPLYKVKSAYWRMAGRRLHDRHGETIRHYPSSASERLFRDLKNMLRLDPL